MTSSDICASLNIRSLTRKRKNFSKLAQHAPLQLRQNYYRTPRRAPTGYTQDSSKHQAKKVRSYIAPDTVHGSPACFPYDYAIKKKRRKYGRVTCFSASFLPQCHKVSFSTRDRYYPVLLFLSIQESFPPARRTPLSHSASTCDAPQP